MKTGFQLPFLSKRYSERARQVVFLARLLAMERGSSLLDLCDLVAALVVEDQGDPGKRIPTIEEDFPRIKVKSHRSFFSPDVASGLLDEIERSVPRAGPLQAGTPVPISDAVKGALKAATEFVRVPHAEIQPLHLLAAVVHDEGSSLASILRKAGVNEQNVLDAINKQLM